MGRTPNKRQPTNSGGAGSEEITGKEQPAASSQTEPQPEKQATAFVERNTGEAPKGKRMTFPVAEDGRIDWKTFRDKNKKEFLDTLKADQELKRLLGMAAAEQEISFSNKDVEQALGWLNSVNKFSTRIVLSRYKKFNIDPDIMDRAFGPPADEEGKANHKELVERGTRLANKYSAEWMRKYADEIFFCALYFKSVSAQIFTAAGMQMQRNAVLQQQAEEARRAKPNGAGGQPQQDRPFAVAGE